MTTKIKLFESLVELRKQMDLNFEDYAKKRNMTSSELLVLLDTHLNPKSSLLEVCERTGFKKSAVSKMVNRLEEKGLITKTTCPKSKREVELVVTEDFLGEALCWESTVEQLVPNARNEEALYKHIKAINKALSKT